MALTLREFLEEENARRFAFVTFTKRGEKAPYAVFTSQAIANRHPDNIRASIVTKEHRIGYTEDSWMDAPVYDGMTIKEVL